MIALILGCYPIAYFNATYRSSTSSPVVAEYTIVEFNVCAHVAFEYRGTLSAYAVKGTNSLATD